MNTHAESRPYTDTAGDDTRAEPPFPAYGPLAALFGFVLFYVVVDRATPTAVDVLSAVLPGVSPSLVRLGLAGFLWFVLAVTVIDQISRQLAALGIGSHDAVRPGLWERVVSDGTRTAVDLGLVLVGGAIAALTAERALDTAVSMIRVVGTLDAGAFDPVAFLVMVVFFVSFGVATHALDRLVVGAVRALLND